MNNVLAGCIAIVYLIFYSSLCPGQAEYKISNTDSLKTTGDLNFELLFAVSKGDTSKVIHCIENGADVNFRYSYEGITPLMYASQNGHLETVRILLRNGAIVNALPLNKVSALMGACIAGHIYVADTLILNGADINTQNLFGVTPLMIAAAFNDSVMADMLLFYNADKEIQDKQGNSALHFGVYFGSIGVTELLIEKQANVNIMDYRGFTPLMIAAQNGEVYLADLLVRNGALIDTANQDNLTALSLSIINNHCEISEMLIQFGADTDHRISKNRNLFSLAKEFSGRETLLILKSRGVSNIFVPIIDKMVIALDINLNPDDFMTGGSLSAVSSNMGFDCHLGYITRIWVRSVLYGVDQTTNYQYWESRSIVHIGIDKFFNVIKKTAYQKSGIYVGLNFSYTYGNFRGSQKKPDDSFHPVPKAGVFWNSEFVDLKLNYEYMKINHSKTSPHRVNLSIGFNINLKESRLKIKEEPLWY